MICWDEAPVKCNRRMSGPDLGGEGKVCQETLSYIRLEALKDF